MVAALVASVLVSPAGALAQHDPSTEWRTVVSGHFRVHYPAGRYDVALDVARASESALEELSDRLGWMPGTPVHVVLSDETDSANGFAQSIPYNLIGVNAVAPEEVGDLSTYDDWVWGLVVHELAHIVHIDTVLGIPSTLNAVFGRWLTPNGVQPRWFIEGLATYFESALSGSGRVRSAYFDMYMRMALLEGAELEIDEMTGFPWQWPQGSIPYLYGGRFVDYLVRRFGEDVLRQISYDYGARIMPFAVNASVWEAAGEAYPDLYDDFLAELRERYEAQRDEVERLGLREGVALTDRGQEIGRPRVAADGTVYFVESPLGAHSVLVALAPDGSERIVTEVYSGAELALLPGGREAVLTQLEIHDVYRAYGDLFRVDLANGELEQLSSGARAHGVDASPVDGRIVFVQNDAVHSQLRLASLDDLEAATLLADLGPRTQVWSPRFSTDGRRVVFAGFAQGRRDIYVVDVTSGEVRALTHDRAVDGGPSFSPDGENVFFHSDRDGVFNIYVIPAAGGELRRVTRVVGGAFAPEPTPDGDAVVYRSYGAKGFDLARVELAPQATGEQIPTAVAGAQGPPIVRTRMDVYPAREYSAASTLLPRAWLPEIGVDTRGTTIGAGVYGSDAVALHSYSLSAWYGLGSERVGFSAAYVNDQFHPGVYLLLDRYLGYALIPYVRNDRPQAVEEEIWSGTVGTSWPLLKERERSLTLTTAYSMTLRQGTQALRLDPLDVTPRFPDQGRFGALRTGLVFSNVRAYTGSISAEEGTRLELNLRLEDPYLGSEHSSVSGTARVTQYIRNPFQRRHVLALDLRGGYGKSSYRRRRLFGVSGLPRSDILLDILGGRVGALGGLRGFPVAPSFVGDAMVASHAEYRLPLHDVESGIETLPIYVRALHAALFVDGAAVADRPAQLLEQRHFSVGMELRLNIVLAYALPSTLRLGYGHGLGRDNVQNVFLVLGGGY